jgi:diguanylate cyclase (GGDEF)-like protein
VAGVLRDVAGPGDHVARIGGDEVALITSGSGLDAMLERIQWSLAVPHMHEGRSLTVGASLGVARSDDFTGPPARLTQAADAALYRAKRNGGHCAELAIPLPVPPRRRAA